LEPVPPNALGAPVANAAKPPEGVTVAEGVVAAVPKLDLPNVDVPKLDCPNPDCPNPLFPKPESGLTSNPPFPNAEVGAVADPNADVVAGAAPPNADAVDAPPNAPNGLFCCSMFAKAPKPVPALTRPPPDESLTEEG